MSSDSSHQDPSLAGGMSRRQLKEYQRFSERQTRQIVDAISRLDATLNSSRKINAKLLIAVRIHTVAIVIAVVVFALVTLLA